MKIIGMNGEKEVLRVSKPSACKEIMLRILEEKAYSNLKECLYDLYGTTLFRAIPVGIRNSILYEYFKLGKHYEFVCKKFLKDTNKLLGLDEITTLLTTGGYLGEVYPVFSYYTRTFNEKYKKVEQVLNSKSFSFNLEEILPSGEEEKNEFLDYAYLYYQFIDESLDEERIALTYLFKLREVIERDSTSFISYKDSLRLLPRWEMNFLSSPQIIYNKLVKKDKEDGEL